MYPLATILLCLLTWFWIIKPAYKSASSLIDSFCDYAEDTSRETHIWKREEKQ